MAAIPLISTTAENPWLGLAAFTEESSGFFYGRDEEISELLRRVKRRTLTVFFGQSGLGKTSLLQAGLFPRLRRELFLPIYLRLDFAADAPMLSAQILYQLKNVAVVEELSGAPEHFAPSETLWAYFHRRGMRLSNRDGRPVIPVLVFDQLEEIFTLGKAMEATLGRRFFTELSDLVENRPPEEVEKQMEEDPEAIDRFEFGHSDYRVLLSLREDYLPHLENLRVSMPSLTQNRMRLNRMNGRQALEAVLKPGGDLVPAEVAEAIVRFVAGAHDGGTEIEHLEVEPSLLSLVCHELNTKRRTLGQTRISADLLAGSSDAILHDFYERCLAGQPPALRLFIEDELLTDSGYRENVALERARRLLEQKGVPPDALDDLVDQRLLRTEERLNVRRVELTHDILTGVVRASRDSRRVREQREESERQRQEALEQRRQAEERERKTRAALRRARFTVLAFGILSVLAVAAAVWAISAQRHAEQQSARARRSEQRAEQEKERAVEAEQVAIEQKKEAQRRAIQMRERNLSSNQIVAALAGRLLDNAAPEEAAIYHSMRANALSMLGRHREAAEEYGNALAINPALVRVRLSRGYEYINLGEAEKSLADTNFAIEHGENSLIAYLNKGHVLGFLGRYPEAEEAVKRGIEVFSYIGMEYIESDVLPELKQATGNVVVYVDEFDAHKALYYELSNLKAYAGDPGFEAALAEARALKPSPEAALFALNWAWQHMHNRPQDYGALAAQAALWEDAGYKSYARDFYERFARAHATGKDARYENLAKWVEVRLNELRNIPLPAPPKSDPVMLGVEARELIELGESAEARKRLEEALEQAPDDISLGIQRAWFFYNQQSYAEARKECDRILSISPKTAAAWFCRALSKYNQSEKRSEVEEDLRKALELAPFDPGVLIWLSDLNAGSDPKQALDLLNQCLKGDLAFSDIPYVMKRMAALNNALGDYEQAAKEARLAIAIKDDDFTFYIELAKAEKGLGRSMAELLREVAGLCRKQGEARFRLGQKTGAFDVCWRGLEFLAADDSALKENRGEILELIAYISEIIGSIGAKGKAADFWATALQSDDIKTIEPLVQEEMQRLKEIEAAP